MKSRPRALEKQGTTLHALFASLRLTGPGGGAGGRSTPSTCEGQPYDACAVTYPFPDKFNTVLDLTDPDPIVGRCDSSAETTWDPEDHTLLPVDASDYPVLIRVSADGFNGSCSYCDAPGQPTTTTYGVALSVPHELWVMTGETAMMYVNEPWRIVSGGCGEACAIPCVNGYQEFDTTHCLGSYARDFGVATDAVDPPDAEVIVALSPDNIPTPCCPWECPR